ncbi:HAD superfamily hydrolase-like protein [Caballeronia hypogeia]|uniref:HAD superfamily hydrolase-like protein n=1 Tax=Caballeronia hypogeia TaxID=1777140 RepID=A0A158AFG9_9BURK|nr:HAD family hydrolase [Caballeronia hypogeia]SAK56553.1 HAD superfamily hydrolase-like protein [Caballeronia hypogeia]
MKNSNVTTVHRFDAVESEVENCGSRLRLFGNDEFKAKLFRKIDHLAPAGEFVLSLDVFDTLLLRDQKSELRRFLEIGQRMSAFVAGSSWEQPEDQSPQILVNELSMRDMDAFFARHLGTKATYRAGQKVSGHGEGSLKEIHSTASKLLDGTERLKDDFIDIELSYEVERLTINDALLSYAKRHKEKGGKVILTSDMYMHSEHIKALLRRLGLDVYLFDLIVSSADTKISKASGKIFHAIEEQLQESSDRFIHIGDSLKGDFVKARAAGWLALHLPISRTEIDQRLADHVLISELIEDKFSVSVDIAPPR